MLSTGQAQTINPYTDSHTIYKLCTLREWDFFQQTGVFKRDIPLGLVADSLRWEPNSTGDLFPHLYMDLKIEHIKESQKISTPEFDFNKLA